MWQIGADNDVDPTNQTFSTIDHHEYYQMIGLADTFAFLL